MKSVFYKRILLPTQDLTASVSSQPTTPTPTNPVSVSYTICGNYKLYGLTNYLDTFNATTKVITHKIGIKVLDGTENWTKRSDTGVNRYQATILNDKVSGTINGLSSHFVSVLAYSQLLDGCFILDATDRVIFDKEDITTASAFKSYLSQQYANGTPVIIYYPLATETTETATEPLQRVETKSFVQYKANPEYRNLPSGYTQVKYLESSGTQCIDLGIGFNSDTDEIKLEFQLLENANFRWIYGSFTSLRFGLSSGHGITYNTSTYSIPTADLMNSKHTLEFNSGGAYYDGVNKASFVSFNNTTSAYLFAVYNNGIPVSNSQAKIWSYQHKRNGNFVRDLVPCYNSNNVAGMYDLANSGKNLFDKTSVETGKSLNSDGTIATRSGWNISEYIEVESSTKYTVSGSEGAGACRTCFYDENKVFISYDQSGSKTYTIPNNAKYIRLSVKDSSLDTTQLEEGSTATAYEPFPFYTNSGTGTFIVGEDVKPMIRVDEKGFAMYQLNPNWHDLPSGYTELEYLESSGTQYIDTGYNVSSDNIKVEVGFDGSSTYKNAWGFVANVGDTGWFTPYGGYNSGYGFYCGTSGNLGQYYFTVGVKTDSVYETNNGTITITRNGTQVLSQAYTGSFTSDAHGNFMLFTQGGASQSSRLSSSYIWYLRLYENNTLVRNLIPARNSNNILGMYDKSWDNTKCGVVDLGTLTWNYVSPTSSAPNGYFVCYNVPQKASSSTNQYLNGYKNGANPSVDKSIWGNNSLSLLCITDFRYTTAEDFKQAMSGKLLYYQRTTDTTYQPPFYTNAGTGTFIAGNVVPKYIKHGG